jgi:hypothetical protein
VAHTAGALHTALPLSHAPAAASGFSGTCCMHARAWSPFAPANMLLLHQSALLLLGCCCWAIPAEQQAIGVHICCRAWRIAKSRGWRRRWACLTSSQSASAPLPAFCRCFRADPAPLQSSSLTCRVPEMRESSTCQRSALRSIADLDGWAFASSSGVMQVTQKLALGTVIHLSYHLPQHTASTVMFCRSAVHLK